MNALIDIFYKERALASTLSKYLQDCPTWLTCLPLTWWWRSVGIMESEQTLIMMGQSLATNHHCRCIPQEGRCKNHTQHNCYSSNIVTGDLDSFSILLKQNFLLETHPEGKYGILVILSGKFAHTIWSFSTQRQHLIFSAKSPVGIADMFLAFLPRCYLYFEGFVLSSRAKWTAPSSRI